MGGHAFKNAPDLRRIKREEIDATLQYVASILVQHDLNLDYEYLKKALMGSAGRQESSGDLDIAMDHSIFDRRCLGNMSIFLRAQNGMNSVRYDGINALQLNSLWPIAGDPANGLVQIDFIYGDFNYLHFTHYSPGLDNSKFGGVWISTALGVLAKMNKLFEYYEGENRIAIVAWAYDLERGLFIRPRLVQQSLQNLKPVSEDLFETQFGMRYPNVTYPRIPRLGYLTDPDVIVRVLFGSDVTRNDVRTFEDLVKLVKSKFTDERFAEFVDRTKEAVKRSSAAQNNNKEALDNLMNELLLTL